MVILTHEIFNCFSHRFDSGCMSVIFLTVLGDEYLELSGYGPDIQLMDEIFATFQFTS